MWIHVISICLVNGLLKTRGYKKIVHRRFAFWIIKNIKRKGYVFPQGDAPLQAFAGKFLGAIISILGIGLFALPAGILGSGFVEEMRIKREQKLPVEQVEQNEKITCPHCGKEISRLPRSKHKAIDI
jgi:hypothetical protein